jgi:hypothetical protein
VEVEVVVEVEMIRLKNVVAVFGERTLGRKRKELCEFGYNSPLHGEFLENMCYVLENMGSKIIPYSSCNCPLSKGDE